MSVSFIRPYLLILIPILIPGIIYSSKWLKRLGKKKKNWVVILRSIVASLLILALCGPSLTWKLDTVTTIFLLDASDSTRSSRTDMEQFVKDAYKLKGQKDKVGVISFGDNSQVENFISSDINSGFTKIEGKINGNYTNIENALTTALSLFPGDSNKRIVLVSDGEENVGEASKIALSLKEQGIDFKFRKVEKNIGDEVSVDKVEVPQSLVLGEEFNVVVTINSTCSEAANISLFSGSTKVAQQKVQLQKGSNKFVFKDKALTGGFNSYKVQVEPEKDYEVKNNEATAYTNVLSKPKVLIIQDTKGEADELVKMLTASSVDFTLVDAKSAPSNVQAMNAYKSIITCNVLADNLNDGFKNSLESYVKDFGGGFIATGGDNSFALGGYANTPLEKVLPVYMDMRGKKETPKMAMVLVIDKSGSMSEGVAGISKVDMAKEAAIRSLDSLRVNKDEIGVMAFDGAYSWVVKKQLITDTKAIQKDIGTIRADGGTTILPALQEAYNSLKTSDAKIKHIILLTDGMAERTGYDDLLKNMNSDNITVSTVAVGQDSDKELLANIAKTCGGRAYVTDQYTNIPSIFSKETFLAARTYLNNREFTPIINSDHAVLKGIAEGGLPTLLGYIGASQKETARVILKSDEDDPILTVWQYGLGKAVAWNSDISGKWSANYIPWDKNLKLWQNLINFTVENYDNEDAAIEVTQQGSKATITLKDKNINEDLDTTATIISPSGVSSETKLNITAPGQYTGTLDINESGVYMVSGKQLKSGEIINSVKTGYAVQYSPEYKINNSNNIDKLVLQASGKIITEPKEVFDGALPEKQGERDITPFLMGLFLILFMIDIAIRRLNISTYKLKSFVKEIRNKSNKIKQLIKYEEISRSAPKKSGSYETIDEPIEMKQENEAAYKKGEADIGEEDIDQETFKGNALDTSELLRKKRQKRRGQTP